MNHLRIKELNCNMEDQEDLFTRTATEKDFATGAQWGSMYKSASECADGEDDTDNPSKRGEDEVKTEPKGLALTTRHLYRRAYGESKLFDILGTDPLQYGTATHVLTGGDIDALSFLQYILKHQSLDWCIMSTWCLATQDILQIRQWVEQSKIKKLDTYVGEKVANADRVQWMQLNNLYSDHPDIGRLVAFKNHSKVFVGDGDKFPFVVTSSANVNTNPRLEQTVITIDRELAQFYRDYYNHIERNV